MMKNSEFPIGFSLELARNLGILNCFANLPEAEQEKIADGARHVTSKSQMRDYVQNILLISKNQHT